MTSPDLIRREMAVEEMERQRRRLIAESCSAPDAHGSVRVRDGMRIKADAPQVATFADRACFNCGVRESVHRQHGCKHWRVG